MIVAKDFTDKILVNILDNAN